MIYILVYNNYIFITTESKLRRSGSVRDILKAMNAKGRPSLDFSSEKISKNSKPGVGPKPNTKTRRSVNIEPPRMPVPKSELEKKKSF